MRLLELLHGLDPDNLERLSEAHLGYFEDSARPRLCLDLESELKGPKHVRDTIFNLRPPGFRVLVEMLETPGYSVSLQGLKERSMEATRALSEAVTAGAVAAKDGVDLYRRVLAEAWRSDLALDGSELALLRVLRQELKIRTVEHFLVEHHRDMGPFWDTDHAFLDAMTGLRSGGLAFAVEGSLVLPEDLAPMVRQVLGLEATRAACHRLFDRVNGSVLGGVAQELGLRASGSKEERVNRLLDNYVQPSEVLERLPGTDLRDMCRALDLPVSGSKDEVVERLRKTFATDADIKRAEAPPPPPPPEARVLTRERFESLLRSLRAGELSDVLDGIGSRRVTGVKERLIQLILESPFSEHTLLSELGAKQLDATLARLGLRVGGSKRDRIDRLTLFFAEASDAEVAGSGSDG